jgi:hypothetical protein
MWLHTLVRFIVLYRMFEQAWRTRSIKLGLLTESGRFEASVAARG